MITEQLQASPTFDNAYSQVATAVFQSRQAQNGNTTSINGSQTSPQAGSAHTDLAHSALSSNNVSGSESKAAQSKTVQQASAAHAAKAASVAAPVRPQADSVQLSATAQAEALHQLGFTVAEIADRLDVSATAVDGFLKITPATTITNEVFTATLAKGVAKAS